MGNKPSQVVNPYQVVNGDCDGLFPDTRKNGATRVLCKLAVNGDQRINRKLDLIMQHLGISLKRSLLQQNTTTASGGVYTAEDNYLSRRNKWTDTNMESQAVKHDWKKVGIPLLIFFGVIVVLLLLGLLANCAFGWRRWRAERRERERGSARGVVVDVEEGQKDGDGDGHPESQNQGNQTQEGESQYR